MKSSAVSAFYLDDKEFRNAVDLAASNDIWLPGRVKALDNMFVCYSGYSQDNMLAMSEIMKDSLRKEKKAYIYEFNILSNRQDVYVREEYSEMVDGVDLTRCDKVILENMHKAAMADGIEFPDVETMRGAHPILDKASFFNAVAENPNILLAGKNHGILPNCNYYRLPYVDNGKEYALLFILDKDAIEQNKHDCTNVTIKLTKRVMVEFPMLSKDSTSKSTNDELET